MKPRGKVGESGYAEPPGFGSASRPTRQRVAHTFHHRELVQVSEEESERLKAAAGPVRTHRSPVLRGGA
uniref:Uncharacterized protein n=1 Tax=Anguilla anguilla TaxID=7936 RepID=A0A0E9R4Z4_ANGAN